MLNHTVWILGGTLKYGVAYMYLPLWIYFRAVTVNTLVMCALSCNVLSCKHINNLNCMSTTSRSMIHVYMSDLILIQCSSLISYSRTQLNWRCVFMIPYTYGAANPSHMILVGNEKLWKLYKTVKSILSSLRRTPGLKTEHSERKKHGNWSKRINQLCLDRASFCRICSRDLGVTPRHVQIASRGLTAYT